MRALTMKTIKFTILMVIMIFALLDHNITVSQTSNELDRALEHKVALIAKRYSDSVVLRWAPSTAALWTKAKANGYTIERAEIQAGKPGAYSVLTDAPIKPWTASQWKQYSDEHGGENQEMSGPVGIASALTEETNDPTDYPENDPGQLDALRESRNRFQMAFNFAVIIAERNSDAANGLGMRYVDKSAKIGTSYMYRITLLGDNSPYRVESGIVEVAPQPTKIEFDNINLMVDEMDRSVLITWNSRKEHSTFDVYRSTDSISFTKLTKVPMLILRNTDGPASNSYHDTNLINYKVYYYKIVGNNAFAENDILGIIKAMPRDVTPPTSPIGVKAMHIGKNDAMITWEMLEPVSSDLAGFIIMRDTAVDAPFNTSIIEKPLEKNARMYRDTNLVLGGTYYYQVIAVDTARNAVRSFPAYVSFVDSTPPSMGVLVKGIMDTNGIVKIIVKHPIDKDLMGYRLLHANDPSHEFTVKRDLFDPDSVFNQSDTIIIDTLEVRTLTKFAYYQVIALDYHFNEAIISNTLAIPRPDIIPPVAPVISEYSNTDSMVYLDFIPSSSRDVRNHIVLRRTYDKEQPDKISWDSISNVGRLENKCMDSTLLPSQTFQYAVIAVDSAGNTSPLSNIISLKHIDNMIRPTVTNVSAIYDSTKNNVMLRWSYTQLTEPFNFVIYKKSQSGFQVYAMIKNDLQREFIDMSEARRGASYAVKVICKSGAESILSESIEVR